MTEVSELVAYLENKIKRLDAEILIMKDTLTRIYVCVTDNIRVEEGSPDAEEVQSPQKP